MRSVRVVPTEAETEAAIEAEVRERLVGNPESWISEEVEKALDDRRAHVAALQTKYDRGAKKA